MRIGIFSDTYIPQINGVSTSIEMLRKGLEKKGHKVYIITVNPDNMKYIKEDRVLRIPGIPIGIFDYRLTSIYPARAIKTIKNWNLDVIHSQTEFGVGTFARILAKQYNIPLVHTYHTMYEDYIHYITKGYFNRTGKKIVEHLTLFYCDTTATELIVPTKKTYDLFKEKYKVKRNVHIVPTGIEVEKYSQKYSDDVINELKEKIGIKKDAINLIFVGRLGLEKSVDFLINNHKNIVKKHPNCNLIIIGDGPERENLEKLVKKNNLGNNIFFTGKVPLKDIGMYYHLGSIFVTASKTETQGLTVLEALAASLPVVAIKDESFVDPIKDNYNGYLFEDDKDYVNYINSLLDNKEKLDKMSDDAYESSHNYSSQTFASNVLKVYKLAIKNKKKKENIFKRMFKKIKGEKNVSNR